MTDTNTPASNDPAPSIASAPSEPLPVDAPVVAKSLGESLYPSPAADSTPNPDPAGVEASTGDAPATDDAPADDTPTEPVGDKPAEGEALTLLTPESYADLKIAEGFTVNEEALSAAKDIFVEAQLPAEHAQKLLDLYTTNLKAASEAVAAAHQEQFTSLNQKWITESNAMPEFQGEAKKQTLAVLGRAMDEFGSQEARDALNITGAGNNPAVVRYILSLAQAVVEGSPTPSGAPPTQDPRKGKSLGQRLYPNSTN